MIPSTSLNTFRLLATAGQRTYQAVHPVGVENVWLELRHCHCLRNEMAHFCTDLQTYIMFEVLETAWHIFMRQLQVAAARTPSKSLLMMCLWRI